MSRYGGRVVTVDPNYTGRITTARDLPPCNRCGRQWMTCTEYDRPGCVGVPLPTEMRPAWSTAQLDYLSAVHRASIAGRP